MAVYAGKKMKISALLIHCDLGSPQNEDRLVYGVGHIIGRASDPALLYGYRTLGAHGDKGYILLFSHISDDLYRMADQDLGGNLYAALFQIPGDLFDLFVSRSLILLDLFIGLAGGDDIEQYQFVDPLNALQE